MKISIILEAINENDEISNEAFEKLEKYFEKLLIGLFCALNYIKKEKIANKYFNNYIRVDKEDLKFKLDIEPNNNGEYPIYYYFIMVILLIVQKLICEKLFRLFKKNMKENFLLNLSELIRKSVSFCKNVIIQISNTYSKNAEKKNNEKSQKNNNNSNNKSNSNGIKENEEIDNYFKNINNNIKKKYFEDIIYLMKKYNNNYIPIQSNVILSSLNLLVSFLDKIENTYNKMDLDGSEISKTCPICLERFSDCHVSPCDHMFCFECLKKLKDFRCPICRRDLTGIKEFPIFRFPQNNQQNNNLLNNNQQNNNNNYIFNENSSNDNSILLSWINVNCPDLILRYPELPSFNSQQLLQIVQALMNVNNN